MRGANAARQRFSVQRMLHHGRDFRQGFSANLAGAENQPTLALKMCGECGGSREFCARKKKWGWMPKVQIALSTSKIVAARRKEREWHLGTFRTISQR